LLIAILAPATLLVTRIAHEGLDAADRIRAATQSGDLDRYLSRLPGLKSMAGSWYAGIDLDSGIRQFSGYLASRISGAISNSAWIITQVFIALFALFFFLRDRILILRLISGLAPLSGAEVNQIFGRIGDTIYASLYGNLAVKLVQGFLGGVMFWALGLPAPVFWGSVMSVLAFVPFIGTGLVWAPAALYLLWQGSWIKAIVLAAWGAGVVSTIDNVIYPIIVGRELRLHTLAVFIAFIGGMSAFGLAGIVLGPAILSILATLIDIWRQRNVSALPDRIQNEHTAEKAAP
jgi:predicted PurR-regulated permease PerM